MTVKEALEQIQQNKEQAAQIREQAIAAGTWGNVSAGSAAAQTTTQPQKTSVDQIWDRGSQPKQDVLSPTARARVKVDAAKKELENYQDTEYDWTDAAERKRYEQGEKQKKAEIAKAEAEQNEAVAKMDRAQMDSLSERDRSLIDEYIKREDTASDPIDTGTAVIAEHFVNNLGIDEARLKELVSTRRRELNAQRMQDVQEKAQAEVNDGIGSAVWENVKTIPANLMAGAMGTMSYIHDLANKDKRYTTLDPNSLGNELNVYSGAVRGQTEQNIVGDGNSRLRNAAGMLYQAGMSAADTGARAAIGGALGLGAGFGAAVAGLNTFSQTMADASARGATPEQALMLAVTTAGIEAATEKVPLDNLIKVSKGGGAKSLVKNILRQAGIEATEEELSLIGTTLADAAIMQEKSEFYQTVAAYMLQGMTEDQAREKANWDLVRQAGETAIVSGIAGGIGGFGAAKYNAFHQDGNLNSTPQQAANDAIRKALGMGVGTEQHVAQNAQATPETAQTEQAQQATPQVEQAVQKATEQDGKAQELRPVNDAIRKALGMDGATDTEYSERMELAQKADSDRKLEKQREKTTYEELQSAKREQKNLEKEIEKAENKLSETGKGSPARIEQLKAELERQKNLVSQIESQYSYFSGDYETNIEAAIDQQSEIFEKAKERAAQAISDHEAGIITDAQLKDAKDAYNNAGAELHKLKNMTQEQYREELGSVGLAADYGTEISDERAAYNQTSRKRVYAAMREGANQTGIQGPGKRNANRNGKTLDQKHMNEAGSTPAGESPKNGSLATPIDSASNNSIPQNGVEVNGNSATVEPEIKGTGAAEQNPNGSRPGTDNSVVGMQNAPSGDFKDSKTFTNTGLRSADADIREGYRQTVEQNPDAPKYEVKHNKDTMATAKERTSTPERVNAEYEYLMGKEVGLWSPEDIVTAKLATKELLKAGEAEKVTDLNIRQKEKGTSVGQETQAYAIIGTMKDSTDPATAVERATERIFAMKESDTTFRKGKDGKDFRQWQKETATEITKIGAAIDQVADGDTKGMIDIITQLSKRRGNTAWFGTRNRLTFVASGILKGMDYSDLKIIANSQLLAMTDDYRARTAMEVTMATRKNAMLTSVKTFLRNLSGNGAVGIMDSASDSSTGQLIDCILSKFTGKRTVGNDFKHSDEYMKGAMNAGKFAALCVELNIPIETDATSAYNAAYGNDTGGKYVGRTFRSTGNPAMRFMYAYQKYMSYALEVTDKIFEGGTNEAVAESLRKLENSGLSDEDIQKLGDYVGNRRTFKDATYTGADGKEHGSTLSRIAQNIKNVGKGTGAEPVTTAITDTIMPFASVPMNVAQTGIDYTVGIGKGILEMASIIKDASAGKEIDVNRQRQAATDFGRGVSGTALIGLFATAAMKGIIKVHNDDDKNKRALEQAEGLNGAQINWDAWARDLAGQSAQWQDGDAISSLDFLEPFNTHMYLGVELAQDDAMRDIPGVANATFSSVYNSLMDTPAMTGLSDFMELCTDMKAADTGAEKMDALAGYAGDVASSFVPQFARQTAQYMDGYYRDTRGNSSAEYAANNILAATPGQSQKLPQKISGLGEVQDRPGFLGTFVDPTKTTTYKENEVTKFLGELSDRVGGDTSFYPDRQAPMKITDGAGREVALDGDARTAYQKTYGDKVNEFYTALIGNYDFSQLPGDLQKEALNEAKEYATQFAKAAVSDYREVPTGSTRNLMQDIVQKKTVKNIANMFTNIDTAWEYGYDDTEIKKNLESAYDVYDGLTMIAKNEMREQAEGDAARYLEVRENGITTDQYLKVKKNVDSQKVQPGFSDIRPAQELTAIASTIGLSERSLDTLMKAWMTDYDPKAKKPDTTELKYDYIRKEMGMSAEQYAKLYDIYSYESSVAGKGTADRTRDRMVNEAKLTEEQAKLVYKLFGGSYKPWKE